MSFATFNNKGDNINDAQPTSSSSFNLAPDLETGSNSYRSSLNETSSKLDEFTSAIYGINRLTSVLGTDRDTPDIRTQGETLMKKSSKLYTELMALLGKLEGQKNIKDNDNFLRFNVERLSEQTNLMHKNYQIILRGYNDKINSPLVQEKFEKMLISTQNMNSNNNDKTPLINNDGGLNKNEYGSEGSSKQQNQTQLQITHPELSENSLQFHNELIQKRGQAINTISQGVQDINKIFKDLDTIVNQQGEQIDSIENSIMHYANNNQLASHELVKADNYQKKKGKWTCILLFALVIFLLIFLALIS